MSQDADDLEVVVSDDSGELAPLVLAMNDRRIQYHRNPQRLGMAGNWNAALDRAQGQLIGLLMDDDWLLPGFVNAVTSQFAADPELGIVFTNHYFQRRDRLYKRRCALQEGRHDDFLLKLLRHKGPMAASAGLMRRKVWEHVRPLPDLLTDDIVLQVRAARAGWPFFYVDQPLMAYRIHGGQLSANDGRFREDRVGVWDMFSFSDPTCETLRRNYLAEALVSRAAACLRRGKRSQAIVDLARARSLDTTALGPRARAIEYLVKHRIVSGVGLTAFRAGKRLRHLWGDGIMPPNSEKRAISASAVQKELIALGPRVRSTADPQVGSPC